MKTRGKGTILATVAGIVALGLLAGRCAPSAPKGAKKGAAVSDIGDGGHEGLRRAGRPGRVLPVRLGRPLGADVRVRPALRAAHLDHPGVHALPRHRLRLRRRVEEDAGRPHLGRRPPPRPLRDERRLRRALALHQRHERPHRPDRPARLQDEADHRARAQRLRQPRLGLRHPRHRVLGDGLALLDPDPEGDGGRGREVRDRLQGRRDRHQGRPQDGRDVDRLADPDAALRLRPRRRRQARLERLGLLHLLQHREGHRQARGHLRPEGPRLHRRRRLEDGGAARGEGRGRR